MGKEHAPSQSRRLLAEGGPVEPRMDAARDIADPGWAAVTLARLAAEPDAPPKAAKHAWSDVRDLLGQIERPSRLAEVLEDVLKRAPKAEHHPLQAEALRLAEELPDGAWVTQAIQAAAPRVDADGRVRLLHRAVTNRGHEADGAKAVLRAAPDDETRRLRGLVESLQDAELKARLLGHLAEPDAVEQAAEAAWSLDDERRAEALRVLAYQAPQEALEPLACSAEGRGPADAARFLTQLGARADKLGDGETARSLLMRALVVARKAPAGKPRVKLGRKLAEALERAGLDAAPARELVEEAQADAPDAPMPEPAQAEPVARGGRRGSGRHTLALVDAYSGGLAAPHLRALARAAPLCVAFDLDLALVGFPTEDAAALVSATAAETNIGEGARHATDLLESGRLTLVPWRKEHPVDWDALGTPVATTPHPAADRAVRDLADVPGPVCLLVGLGRQGLPKGLLDVSRHYELTGKGISLETATAMGVLADRLGRLARGPAPRAQQSSSPGTHRGA